MLKDLLKNYTTLKIEIENDRARIGLDIKERRLAETESKIKEAGRKASDDEIEKAKNDHFLIRIDKPFRKWYDWKAIKKFASKKELVVIEKQALRTEIDKEAFEELVNTSLVSRELRTKPGVFKEETLTPRVSIVPIKKHA